MRREDSHHQQREIFPDDTNELGQEIAAESQFLRVDEGRSEVDKFLNVIRIAHGHHEARDVAYMGRRELHHGLGSDFRHDRADFYVWTFTQRRRAYRMYQSQVLAHACELILILVSILPASKKLLVSGRRFRVENVILVTILEYVC